MKTGKSATVKDWQDMEWHERSGAFITSPSTLWLDRLYNVVGEREERPDIEGDKVRSYTFGSAAAVLYAMAFLTDSQRDAARILVQTYAAFCHHGDGEDVSMRAKYAELAQIAQYLEERAAKFAEDMQ